MSEDGARAPPKPPSVDRLSHLWRRINDHKIVQWSVAYVAVAYGLQHGVILTSESFDWPHVVSRISMLLLVLGLPLVMTLAWYHGERASRQFTRAELSIISILLVIGSLLFYVFVRPSEEVSAGPKPTVQQASVAAARTSSAAQSGAISIAVLPFANMSGDASQEFFSDGMTEEINGALAKVPELHVVARSSAFEFKGRDKEARAVGQALSASHLIEGSVRKAGNRVRISAQLVRADNGLQLWSENYDRELTDIFAIQEDIAQAIAASLRVPLGLQQGDTLVRNRTKDLESYDQYLLARALFRARGTGIAQAITILEKVVARDPGFAPAWGLLARAYVLVPPYNPAVRSGPIEEARRVVQSSQDKAEKAAREAIRLDSRNANSYGVLGAFQGYRGKWAAAEDLFKQALALDPNEPEVLQEYSIVLAGSGRIKDSLSITEKLRTLEPFVPIYNLFTASIMQASGQSQATIPILEAIPADAAGGFYRNAWLAKAYAAEGRYAAAADTLLLITTEIQVSRRSAENAARLLRSAPAKVKAPQALPALEGDLNFVYAYIGASDRVLEAPERLIELHDVVGAGLIYLWSPEVAPLRKTERFKALMRKDGLVDYWRERGWPDLCRPMGAADFVCD